MDEINVNIKGKSLKRIGIWVLVYDILCVGVGGFILGFGFALGIGDSSIFYKASIFAKIARDIFNFLMGWGWMLGFVLLLIGGMALLFNKNWGKTISIIGIWFCFALAVGAIGLTFTCCIVGWGFGADFLFFDGIAGAILIFAILILRKLKQI